MPQSRNYNEVPALISHSAIKFTTCFKFFHVLLLKAKCVCVCVCLFVCLFVFFGGGGVASHPVYPLNLSPILLFKLLYNFF